MNTSGRGDNRPRRRGNARRNKYIAAVVGIIVIFIVYRHVMSDDDSTYGSSRDTSSTQNRFVQKEIRTEEPKMGPNVAQNPPENTGDDDQGDDDDADERNDDNDDDDENNDDVDDKNFPQILIGEQNKTEVNKLNMTLSKTNLTYTPVQRMNPFLSENKWNISTNKAMLNMTISAGPIGVQAKSTKEATDLEAYKVKLAEDFAAQTKELANLVQNALNRNATNLTDINWQNKTKPVDGNLTKLIENFSFKAQNAMKLAKDLLFNKTVSLPGSNQAIGEQNKTNSDAAFSMETQDLIKIANDVFSDTSKSALQIKDETKTKFLDKYTFDAQKLAKFASSLVSNATMKMVDTQQKLKNLELPVPLANKLPLSSDVKKMTEKVLV